MLGYVKYHHFFIDINDVFIHRHMLNYEKTGNVVLC